MSWGNFLEEGTKFWLIVKISCQQEILSRTENPEQILLFLNLIQMLQIQNRHISLLQLFVKVYQLINKVTILAQTAINLELIIAHMRQHLIKNHGQTSIIQLRFGVARIENEISSHLSKTSHRNLKGCWLRQVFQDLTLLLKWQGIRGNIKDPLSLLSIAGCLLRQNFC